MMNRRDLLEWLIATGGLAALGRLPMTTLESVGRATHEHARLNTDGAQTRLRSLDATTAAVVTAAAERIIPRTDTPGATDARVTEFIDVMLSDWYEEADRDRFVAGIRTLDADAKSTHGHAFVQATEAEQVALLEEAEARVVALRRTNARAANESWFGMLKYLTVYGYCTSEPGMRQHLQSWPMPMTYDPAAPVNAR
jgi:hypothetical protein